MPNTDDAWALAAAVDSEKERRIRAHVEALEYAKVVEDNITCGNAQTCVQRVTAKMFCGLTDVHGRRYGTE